MAKTLTHLFIALSGVLQTFSSTLPPSRSTQHWLRAALSTGIGQHSALASGSGYALASGSGYALASGSGWVGTCEPPLNEDSRV